MNTKGLKKRKRKEKRIMNNKKDVVLFFACEESYAPFFGVSLESIRDHADENRNYVIKCLYTGNIEKETRDTITGEYSKGNIDVEFVDITDDIKDVFGKLHTRDYYTKTTYYRLFIPRLYPEYDKVLYLDSDIVLKTDVAELYDVELGENYVGAIPDESVQLIKEFQDYTENRIRVRSYKEYFNAGVLLMNCRVLREINFEKLFITLLGKVTFNVAQDQDYLNAICKGKVRFIGAEWDKMPISPDIVREEDVKLIHFNLSFKPWRTSGIMYEDAFWHYSDKSVFGEKIREIRKNADPELQKIADAQTAKLIETCAEQAADKKTNDEIENIIRNIFSEV